MLVTGLQRVLRHPLSILQVLASAHAVVLASGTLAPVASLQQQLFSHVPPERMHHFSCGHVVLLGPASCICSQKSHAQCSPVL